MLRLCLTLCLTLLCSLSHAALPPAPLTISAAQEVANEFRDHYEDDFKYEMSRVAQSVFPTPEQSYVYAKYMNKAFAKAGYSLDGTLYDYFKSGGPSGGTAGSPNILFSQKLNLTVYADALKNAAIANAFIKANAVSEKTIAYAKDVAKDLPINNADYLINGTPGYSIPGTEGYSRENGRFIGQVKIGTGPWEGWLYLEWEARRGEQYGIGIAQVAGIDVDEAAIFKALNGKRVKAEGIYFIAKGLVMGDPNTRNIAIDPLIFDMSHDLVFKEL